MTACVVTARYSVWTPNDGHQQASVSFAVTDEASDSVCTQIERVARLVPPDAVWTVKPETESTR